MVLQEFNVSQGWVQMKWDSMFRMGWPNIMYALKNISGMFESMTVLVGNYGEPPTEMNIEGPYPRDKEIVLVKGVCKIFNTPAQIIFKPGSQSVDIMAISKFTADYESLSKAYWLLADSIELYVYTANN